MTAPVSWAAIKPLISIRPMFYADPGCSYIISVPATGFYCIITKANGDPPEDSDQYDFEQNYKQLGNQ